MKILEEHSSFFVTDKTKYVVINYNYDPPYFTGLFSSIEKCEETINDDMELNNSGGTIYCKRINYAIIPCIEDLKDAFEVGIYDVARYNERTFNPIEAYALAREEVYMCGDVVGMEGAKIYQKKLIEEKDE